MLEFARLQGNFSNDGKAVDNTPLETVEYASEQEKETNSLSPPVNVQIQTDDNTIEVSWLKVDQASYYKIYRHTSYDVVAATKIAESEDNRAYDLDFQSKTRYFYWVKSCNDDGCSAKFSTAKEIISQGIIIPLTPQNIVAEEITSSSVQLSWDTSSNASEYRVYRSQTNDFFTAKRIARVVLSSHVDYGLNSGTKYFYWLEACDKGACSEPSTSTSATGSWSVPQGLRNSSVTSTSLTLTWDKLRDVGFYQLVRTMPGETVDQAVSLGVTPSVILTDYYLQPSTTYVYWLRICKTSNKFANCSDFSDPVSAITGSTPTDAQEQDFSDSTKSIPTHLKGRTIKGTSLVLSWNAVSNKGTVSYEVLRSEGEDPTIDSAQSIGYPII